jgi:hypothetical protein
MRATQRFGLIILGLAALTLFSGQARAAVIYTQGQITGDADVLNIGTVVVANNLGAGAVPVTINGVAFGNSTAGLSGFVNATGDFSNQFPVGSPLDLLLSDLAVQPLAASTSLTLSGLSPGQDYLLQIFLSNVTNSTGMTSRLTIQGQAYDIQNFGLNADFIRAEFIASSSTEVVTFGKGSLTQSDRMIVNAYALEAVAVPEPSTLALLTLGGAALTGWRRWRKRAAASSCCRT